MGTTNRGTATRQTATTRMNIGCQALEPNLRRNQKSKVNRKHKQNHRSASKSENQTPPTFRIRCEAKIQSHALGVGKTPKSNANHNQKKNHVYRRLGPQRDQSPTRPDFAPRGPRFGPSTLFVLELKKVLGRIMSHRRRDGRMVSGSMILLQLLIQRHL